MNIRCLTLFLLLTVLCIAGTEQASAFYNPGTGRWLSKDPIAENGGVNLYAICNNNTVSATDGLGLMPDSPNYPSDSYLAGQLETIRQLEYNTAKEFIKGPFADRLLRNYIWGNGTAINLSKKEVQDILAPQVSLTQSTEFQKTLREHILNSSSFKGEYQMLTFDYKNGAGGLGRYYVHAKVSVDCPTSQYWKAKGVAWITDTWDFDATWTDFVNGVLSNYENSRPDLTGRGPRTYLGSYIIGQQFEVKSVEVPASQDSKKDLLRFEY